MKIKVLFIFFLMSSIVFSKVNYRIIIDRNIFSPKSIEAEKKVEYPEVVRKFTPPEIDKIFKVAGTIIFEEDRGKNIVILEDTKTKSMSFRKIGDIINGFKILEIDENEVIFESDGEKYLLNEIGCECLTIPKEAIVFEVKMGALLEVIEKQSNLIEKIEVKKIKKDGNFIGFEIGGIEKDSFLEEFGIQNKDIITGINGHLFENEDFYFDFYEAILRQEIKRVEIKFLRDGKHHIYIYHFIP
ncbi:MAG TPA: hypothetical protein PLW95_07260 [bacterium]|nr:hypothetical protein [bacterium]